LSRKKGCAEKLGKGRVMAAEQISNQTRILRLVAWEGLGVVAEGKLRTSRVM